jgi:hypothetical protein
MLKDLKPSTRQRFVALDFDFPGARRLLVAAARLDRQRNRAARGVQRRRDLSAERRSNAARCDARARRRDVPVGGC